MKKYLTTAVIILLIFVSSAVLKSPSELFGAYDIVRVVDGDTVVVDINGEDVKVRFIGIDTPESVHSDASRNTESGAAAAEYTRNLLEGKRVFLEYDVERYDQYDRTLAYVYLNDGETMVNELLLEEGYASVLTVEPNVKYAERFKNLQKEAQRQELGIWEKKQE